MSAPNDSGMTRPRTPLGYLWAGLAVVTCPCHVLILAVVLSGTAFEAFLSENLGAALFAGTLLFFVFVAAALRSWKN